MDIKTKYNIGDTAYFLFEIMDRGVYITKTNKSIINLIKASVIGDNIKMFYFVDGENGSIKKALNMTSLWNLCVENYSEEEYLLQKELKTRAKNPIKCKVCTEKQGKDVFFDGLSWFHCPECDSHGLPSIHGNMCTVCANAKRFS
jgi:Zn finger protein HypA/HybF involved in hydrogenase expression